MRYYIDSSTLLKRILAETGARETVTMLAMLRAGGGEFVTSALTEVEIFQALSRGVVQGRLPPGRLDNDVALVLGGVTTIAISRAVIDRVRTFPSDLRTLDAIHLATARLAGADMVVTDDDRMARACMQAGVMTMRAAEDVTQLPDGWGVMGIADDKHWPHDEDWGD